ncbi:MAG: flagellar protein FlaG [Bryobacteraceae bacterium]
MNFSSISNLASHLSASTQGTPKPPPSEDQKALLEAVKVVNAAQLFGQENEVTFIIDRAANIAVVRIVNKETGKLVQQIPNEQMLRLAEESSGR